MLADANIEKMCEKACDDAFAAVQKLAANANSVATDEVNDVFEAEFLRSFKGPVPDKLFIERDGRLRLALEVMFDFFNPNGTRKRGNHQSIGLLAVANLNLNADIRYRPEYLWISIVAGPRDSNHDQLNHYMQPLMDDFVDGWTRGLRLSRTALHPRRRRVDIIAAISVNDLPAMRKVIGMDWWTVA